MEAFKAAVIKANEMKRDAYFADPNTSDSLRKTIISIRGKAQAQEQATDQPRSKRSMAEQMRIVIFYKVLMKRLDDLKQFQKQSLHELSALASPTKLVFDLCAAVASILNFKGEQTWTELVKLINPQNIRLFTQINVVEVRRESLLPFRNFAAKVGLDEVIKANIAAGMLYIWAQMVNEIY